MLARDIRDCREIECTEHHGPRTLEPYQLRVRLYGTLDIIKRDIEKKRVVDSKALQVVRELEGRTVSVIDEEDVVAGAQQSHDHGAHCGYPRPERFACFTALERGELFLQYLYGGILAASVDVIVALVGMGSCQGVEARKGEQRCLHDRCCHRLDGGPASGLVLQTDPDIIGRDVHSR